jgi:hypothetical protein
VPIWISHEVDLHVIPFTKEEGLEIIQDTLKIILPYVAHRHVVTTAVDVTLDEYIEGTNGNRLVHGRTKIFYCTERSAVRATIQLSRSTLINSDALISTLLHELAHLLHATTISTCLKQSVDGCGGHDNKFYEINAMLVMMFKYDLRSTSMILDPFSNVYDVSRFVTFNVVPRANHAAASQDRILRCTRSPKKMKGESKDSKSKGASYNIY